MRTARYDNIRSHRYGNIALWILAGNLGGSRAKRLTERANLHFVEAGDPLVLDLREAAFIDTQGARSLEEIRRRQPLFSLVGRPRDFNNLPLPIRETIDLLRPEPNLERALTSMGGPLQHESAWAERRRHFRISVLMPVELSLGTMSTTANLHDISLGGVRIGHLPVAWLQALRDIKKAPSITIAGMDLDPLGREIVDRYNRNTVESRPVHILHGRRGLGLSFSEIPPVEEDGPD